MTNLRRCEVPTLRPKMNTEEEVMEPPTINTKNTTITKTSAKEKEETWLDKEDSGQCENPKDLLEITGGQILKYNHVCGQIYLIHKFWIKRARQCQKNFPSILADFSTVFFHISYWYLLWNTKPSHKSQLRRAIIYSNANQQAACRP